MADTRPPKIAGEPPPEPELIGGSFMRVDWARLGLPVRFICLSESPYGRYLHWVASTSHLCTMAEACPWCHGSYKRTWYAFLPGHCMQTGDVILAMIPEDSFRRAIALHDGGLLGRIITLERPGNGPTRVRVTVSATATRCRIGRVSEAEMPRYVETAYARMAARRAQR